MARWGTGLIILDTNIPPERILGAVLTPTQLTALRAEPAEPNRVAAARKLLGLSQVAFGEAIGVLQSGLSKLENGQRQDITLASARQIADFIGAHVDDVFPPPPRSKKKS